MARFGLSDRMSRRGLIVIFLLVILLWPMRWTAGQPVQPDGTAILNHLNAAISWYRRIASLDVTAGQPSDVLYLQNARSSGSQALQLAFQSALAEAALAKANEKASAESTENGANPQPPGDQQSNLAKAAADTANRISQAQSQIAELNKQIDRSAGKKRQQLLAQRDALQGELDLDKMIQDALQKISGVVSNNESSTGLAGQINQLKQSVPEAFAAGNKKDGAGGNLTSNASRAQNSGLLGQTSILFGQMRDIHDIDQLMSQTVRLRDTAEKLDAPLRASLKSLIQQGRAIVNRPPSSDPAEIAATRKTFQTLTTQFKQTADAAVPLRQEIILLDQCHGELLEWRNSIATEYGRVLRSLLTRVAAILIALAFVFFLSEIWRRATYRYIHEARRRRQVMLIRRFVTGFLMVVVIAMGFISEFSSLATFAGFLTAGIAVALQTVILSIAAYFFLIGRYGVRVGDRITVQGVTGDVIDVGLVRLYLMELAGTGIDLNPTGRVVVFSNSVMFQATPFFKQLPGSAYAWHEIAVTLSPENNYAIAEQKLLDAVNSVFSKYQHNIERQHAVVQRLLDTPIAAPAPQAKLNFSDSGLEVVVRYPVEIRQSSGIDDEVTRKVMEVIGADPDLKTAVSGSPRMRSAIKA